jgi:hypothetical protein
MAIATVVRTPSTAYTTRLTCVPGGPVRVVRHVEKILPLPRRRPSGISPCVVACL